MKYRGDIVMVCVCTIAAAIGGALEPSVYAGAWLVFLAFLLPPAALIAAFNGSDSQRAFWIGAAWPASCAVLGMILVMTSVDTNEDALNGGNLDDVAGVVLMCKLVSNQFRMIVLFLWSLMPVTGFVCMIANAFIRPSTEEKTRRKQGSTAL